MANDIPASRNSVVIGSPEWQREQDKRREEKYSALFWKHVDPSQTTSQEKELVLYLMEQAAEQELAAIRSEQQPITDNDKRWRILEHGCKWVSVMPRDGEGRCFYLDDVQDVLAMRKFADSLSKRQVKLLKEAIAASQS